MQLKHFSLDRVATKGRGGVYWSQSGPQHGGHISVSAVDPQHQRQGDGHEGPGDAVSTCRQRAAFTGRLLQLFTKVQSVAHLNGDEHRQGHGHGVGRLEHLAVQTVELWVVWAALEEVALWGGRQGGEGGLES
ncbi:hypothetical protein INR49_016699 [Caranx melampygus]|nr:hypothetical protein INR49_016699 [Caranx melampygus]